MGREIRRVPANYAPEKIQQPWGMGYHPMFDETFAHAVADWEDARASYKPEEHNGCSFDDWRGKCPSDPAYYRPWSDEEAVWFQVWETVSEGTPVTPAFATKEELIEHLVAHGAEGDLNADRRTTPGWDRTAAEKFIRAGRAPSFVMIGDGKTYAAGDEDYPL